MPLNRPMLKKALLQEKSACASSERGVCGGDVCIGGIGVSAPVRGCIAFFGCLAPTR